MVEGASLENWRGPEGLPGVRIPHPLLLYVCMIRSIHYLHVSLSVPDNKMENQPNSWRRELTGNESSESLEGSTPSLSTMSQEVIYGVLYVDSAINYQFKIVGASRDKSVSQTMMETFVEDMKIDFGEKWIYAVQDNFYYSLTGKSVSLEEIKLS